MPMKVRYTVLDGEVISERRNGVLHDYMVDPLGSTIGLVDSTQSVTDTFAYSPFGEVVSRTGTTTTPFQYVGSQGYYKDSSSRSYVRARTLNVNLGRWMTQDPIGFGGGDWNVYRYVMNNSINQTDPSGNNPIIIIGVAVGLFALSELIGVGRDCYIAVRLTVDPI